MKNKYEKLIGNSIVFAIGNFGSKLMQFIMVPIYSYTLSTNDFGKVDVLTTMVSLLMPIISFDIFDAVFRFVLDENEDKKSILNTGFFLMLISTFLAVIIGGIVSVFVDGYPILLTLLYLIVSMYYALISNYVRGIGKVKTFAFAGIVSSFAIAIFDVILLLVFKQGMQGYLLALIFGTGIALLYLMVSTKLLADIHFRLFRLSELSRLLKYSLPLIPNTLAWWLNTASDRFFILAMLGPSFNGIYAMANKIPNILNVFTNIFFQSWQISVVEELNQSDGKRFVSNVFESFISFLFIGSVVIIAIVRPLFHMIISPSYYESWKLIPLLLVVVIFSSLTGFLGTIYTATKKTIFVAYTTIVGAIINVVLTIILIKKFGIYGAAMANSISFIVVSGIRFIDIYRTGLVTVRLIKFLELSVLYVVYTILVFQIKSDLFVLMTGILICGFQVLIDKELREIIKKIYFKIKDKVV